MKTDETVCLAFDDPDLIYFSDIDELQVNRWRK
jgi:hypothetical protein